MFSLTDGSGLLELELGKGVDGAEDVVVEPLPAADPVPASVEGIPCLFNRVSASCNCQAGIPEAVRGGTVVPVSLEYVGPLEPADDEAAADEPPPTFVAEGEDDEELVVGTVEVPSRAARCFSSNFCRISALCSGVIERSAAKPDEPEPPSPEFGGEVDDGEEPPASSPSMGRAGFGSSDIVL